MLEEFVRDFANSRGDGFHVEDELSIGEKGSGDEGSIEVVVARFDIEGASDKFREVGSGSELIVKDAFEPLGGDFSEGKLSPETLKDLEVCNGEIEIFSGESDRCVTLVADFAVEVAQAVDQGVDLGFAAFEICDGGRPGFCFREGFIGVGLFFDAIPGGGNENEDHDGHHNENETASEGGAWGVLVFGSVWSVGHEGSLNSECGRLNSEL